MDDWSKLTLEQDDFDEEFEDYVGVSILIAFLIIVLFNILLSYA